jgi:flavin-dependent dehydrogenase
MTKRRGHNYDAIIAGAGPAGSSAAIRLAMGGARVLLLDQKKFPRAKVCGEFISPECRDHFRQLGVEAQILLSKPAFLTETVFYSSSGHSVTVPTEWFGSRAVALGLSRSEMDYALLLKAKALGVTVLEEATISDVLTNDNQVIGLRVKLQQHVEDYYSRITIDATGRTRLLVRKIQQQRRRRRAARKPKLVAFKAHVKNAGVESGACEIYSYRGGYGGLSQIEGDVSNLCFIIAAEDVRRYTSNPHLIVNNVISQNRRAAETLLDATVCSDWLSVSLERFGSRTVVPHPGLITVGDASAFIDPFTGSGMLMAFESAELAATTILKYLVHSAESVSLDLFGRIYKSMYQTKFDRRLRISGWLRRAAFVPYAAEAAILFFSVSDRLRRKTARATRSARSEIIPHK